ncbi:MAG: PorP/SprF family type IX secretion system membrane protein [Bacteroidales bacterium]|jgi:type IX secretion system PorP/SprF family membrane protein|nr:PorP/SprF family type IX secretion system membrane protein [Bacteroidales bacterium]MDI9576155.1 PorP/SprF family type IX secretion system membrane protein [Bacteroidota bacterium]
MKKFLFVIFLISVGVILRAQDVHFSQFYEAPLSINPSFTGYFDGNHRIMGNYKSQWHNIQNGFNTFDLSYEYSFYNPARETGFLGLGVFFYNDVSGPLKLSTQNYTLNVAYHVRVGDGNYIGAGIYGGYVQKAIDDAGMQWGSQYDEDVPGYNPNIPSGEFFEKTSFGVPDFGFGLQWNMIKGARTMSSNDGYRINLGVGLHHLNQPKYKFYTGSEEQLKMRISIHAQAQIGIENTNLSIMPRFLYMMQGKQDEILPGLLLRFTLKEEAHYTGFERRIYLTAGGYYRTGDAAIAQLMLEIGDLALGFSYDINISDLSAATSNNGGFEVSLRYLIRSKANISYQ